MRISDVLRGKGDLVVTIGPEEDVRTLLDRLAENRIGAIVVAGEDGGIAGIVSERDVVRGMQREGAALLDRQVGSIMTADVHTCAPEASIEDLMVEMTEHRFRHVPVVADGRMCGIVSIGDVVKYRIEELQSERDHLTAYITG
ncbi:MAG: CBS domain-containing protein [Actinomycetales bacterium]|nr:CBS domain-containing protein [Actinomycetales bacterium]